MEKNNTAITNKNDFNHTFVCFDCYPCVLCRSIIFIMYGKKIFLPDMKVILLSFRWEKKLDEKNNTTPQVSTINYCASNKKVEKHHKLI